MQYVSSMAKIKRRKAADIRKEATLSIRLAESHKAEIDAAAQKAGISVTAWVIERLLRVARQENAKE